MKKPKKTNKVIQIRESELKKIKKEATDDATEFLLTVFLTVLRDGDGYGKKRLCRTMDRINDLCDSIVKGYCSLYDLEKVLYDEARIVISGGAFDKPKYKEGGAE